MASKAMWEKRTWQYPRPHDFQFGFGLDMDDTAVTKNSTIMPYLFQDNAQIDYETIKTNPENDDFGVFQGPNVAAGSFIPKLMVQWKAFSPSAEVDVLNFKTMTIGTAMLNRLDAFDKKTGNDVETILELTHETTDEQAGALYNTVKLYEGHHVQDFTAGVPFTTGTGQPEGVAFDMEMYFDALRYYTNKEMLRSVTGRMRNHYINGDLAKDRRTFEKVVTSYSNQMTSKCKFQHPYTYCGELFHCPTAGTINQLAKAADVTAVEHLTVIGRVAFNEYNPDFNYSRA